MLINNIELKDFDIYVAYVYDKIEKTLEAFSKLAKQFA